MKREPTVLDRSFVFFLERIHISQGRKNERSGAEEA
jgi:hypothetical protein